ncbi:FAD-dependent monooxygenase [Serinicoccus marinus]|uniref:FAD-dependent monooxygenase n=1 Tax=Serinicoccus marinus TaxID=247333 RepID=UPI0024901D48|nr:FAD-dependent monooxygenase [Serinicoccus marinus]
MRAVVSGAGISGLAIAHVLAGRGWEVDLVEVAGGPRTEGYTLDLFGRGYDAAERLGVLPAIHERGRVYRAARFVRADGRGTAELPLSAFADLHDGRFVSITRGGLEEALRTSLPGEVRIRFGTSITGIEDDPAVPGSPDGTSAPARVSLEDGTQLEADLVLVAEGLHSPTRDRLFPDASIRHLGFVTGAFSTRAPQIASELGLTVQMSDTARRQVGTYAVDEEHVSVFALAPGHDVPADRLGWVRGQLEGAGPAAAALRDVIPQDDLFVDVVAQSVAPRWREGRLLLMGDAAHAVSLLAGQGASLSIAGAVALGDALEQHDDPIRAADAYAHGWRTVVEPVQRSAVEGSGSFVPANAGAVLVRRLVLHAARIPVVARMLTRSIGGAPTH